MGRSHAPRDLLRGGAELAALTLLMLGGTYVASWLAARGGLAVSRGLVFEGRWFAPSWSVFPWADCAAMLAFMVVLPLAWERVTGSDLRSVGLRVGLRGLAFVPAAVACAALVYGLRWRAGAVRPVADMGAAPVIVAYLLVAAVAEEVCFRGVIQRRLTTMAGVRLAIPLAGALFVAWHGAPGSPWALAFRCAAALGLGALYQFSGSLLPPVVCHWVLSLAAV